MQQNKECLINISKFKFSMVISGLTKTLSKISEMQPTIRSGHSLNFFSVCIFVNESTSLRQIVAGETLCSSVPPSNSLVSDTQRAFLS